MKNEPPMLGQYVKLIKTGEIVKNRSFDPKALTVEVESITTGAISIVNRNNITRITIYEEFDFLKAEEKDTSK